MIYAIWRDGEPPFPATAQHPQAQRYTVYSAVAGKEVLVDAVGEPSQAEVDAALTPLVLTPEQKLAAAGFTVPELRQLLGLS